MFEFVQANILLVLTVIGAVISFMASFIGLVAKKKPVLVLAVLGVLGFVVGITYQLSNYAQNQEKARRAAAEAQIKEAAQRARDGVLQEINENVGVTRVTVDAIARKLESASLQEVGLPLVSVKSVGSVEFEETMAFAKGSSEMWQRYAQWLATVPEAKAAACLTVTLNASPIHHYDAGLLLAYLLTSTATRDELLPIVDSHQAWHNFAAEPFFLKNFKPQTGHLRYVLFYEGPTQKLLAFAEAEAFAQQLMVLHRLGRHAMLEALFNSPHSDPVAALRSVFPSVQAAVFDTDRCDELVRRMIEQQLPLAVAAAGPRPYVAKLTRMIRLAAADR